jgi:hypothetical protein
MKKSLILLLIIFAGCSSTPQSIRVYHTGENTKMFFLPPVKWEAKNDVTLVIDFTFREPNNMNTLCNISISQKNQTPKGISSIVFYGDGTAYPVSGMKGLFVKTKENLLRLTSSMPPDQFLAFIKSENCSVTITMDNAGYECFPSQEFYRLKDEFLSMYFINDLIINEN